MHPVTEPSMNGMGHTPSFMVEEQVLGFFRDAEDKQPIIGTFYCSKLLETQTRF